MFLDSRLICRFPVKELTVKIKNKSEKVLLRRFTKTSAILRCIFWVSSLILEEAVLVKVFGFFYLKAWINGQKHWLDCAAQSGDLWTVFTGKGPWHLYGFKENKCRRCNQRVYSCTLFLHWKVLDITCNLCILHTSNRHKMLIDKTTVLPPCFCQ